MAITVTQAWAHGLAALKLPSTAFSAEEVRSANDIQSRISTYCLWHWLLAAGTNVAISSGTQDYTINSADQNKVQAIYDANLLEGSTEQPQLSVASIFALPKTSTTGQPIGVCLLSPTSIRLWPTPDATYTFQWRYYARPITFAANSESYQCPDNFENVILNLNIWKLMQLMDDDRADNQYKIAANELAQLKESEMKTVSRMR